MSNVVNLWEEVYKRHPRPDPRGHDYDYDFVIGLLVALKTRIKGHPDIADWYQAAIDSVLEVQQAELLDKSMSPIELVGHLCSTFGGFNAELLKIRLAHAAAHEKKVGGHKIDEATTKPSN